MELEAFAVDRALYALGFPQNIYKLRRNPASKTLYWKRRVLLWNFGIGHAYCLPVSPTVTPDSERVKIGLGSQLQIYRLIKDNQQWILPRSIFQTRNISVINFLMYPIVSSCGSSSVFIVLHPLPFTATHFSGCFHLLHLILLSCQQKNETPDNDIKFHTT